MTKEKLNAQRIGLRADHSIYKLVKDIATKEKKSINRLIIDLIKKNLGEKREKDSEGLVVPSEDKKATECRLPFNASEVVILKQYAKGNSWSVTKEVRHRVIGTISEVGKISPEELQLIKGIRVSINTLGRNINTIIKNGRIVDQEGKDVCIKLIDKISEVREEIVRIEQDSEKRFLV